VAWLLPELEVGAEPELNPLEFEELEFEELELEPVEPVEPEFVLVDPPEVEPEPELVEVDPEFVEVEPEFVEVEPVDVLVDVLCVEPGRTRASAPAVTTLAMPTAVVAERTLFRPRALAAMARRMPSRCSLLMSSILRPGIRCLLRETSPLAMRGALGPRLPRARGRG
jgi:hypothetical protein